MKFFALIGLLISSFAFSGTIDGLKFSNLPTVSKSYSAKSLNDADLPALAEKIKAECVNDRLNAMDLVNTTLRSKLISYSGCTVKTVAPQFTQGGATQGEVSTSFEVIFK